MTKDEGRQALLSRWAPMPRYLLRRSVVRQLIRKLQPRDFIEIGAASGEMTQWMNEQGMNGVAVEISPSAVEMLKTRLERNSGVEIHTEDARTLDVKADLLLSTEVLEHIEDDHEALRSWYQLIRPGGHVLLSVPAGSRLYSVEDVMAGHFRRYEKRELIHKLEAAGFSRARVLSYGFPLSFILRRLRMMMAKRKLRNDNRSIQERTEASGVERQFLWLRCILNNFCFLPFILLQLPFLRLDWTDGYIALARKPTATS